jgi:hypothetical protein
VLIVCLAGCATRPPAPFSGPEVTTGVRHRAGDTIEGPTAVAALPDAGEFHQVSVRLIALAGSDPTALEPLLDHATLVLHRNEETPFLPAPRLLRATRLAFGAEARDDVLQRMQDGDFGGFDPITRRSGVFAPGTTAEFEFLGPVAPDLPEDRAAEREGMRISIEGRTDGVPCRIALSIARVVPPLPPLESAAMADDEADPGALAKEMQRSRLEDEAVAALVREAVVIEPATTDLPLVLTILFVSPFPEDGGRSILAIVDVSTAPAKGTPDYETHEMRVARFRQEEEAAREQSARILSPIPRALWSGLDSALTGLSGSDRRRNALAWLSRETKARITEDLALTAQDASIGILADAIVTAAADLPRPLDPTAVGILCEKVSGGLLLEYATRRDSPPGIDALLLRHTGEVGRHPAMLEETLADSKSVADFNARLVHENLLFLEDSSPVARVRAFDWLSLKALAPDGYAPLDDRKTRRKALEAWHEARAEGGRQ